MALGARDAGGNGAWRAFTSDGTPLASFEAWPLHPQPVGWQGAVPVRRAEGGVAGVAVLTFSRSGRLLQRYDDVNIEASWVTATWWDLRQDPLGGSALFVEWSEYWTTASWGSDVVRISAEGGWMGRAGRGAEDVIAGGVSSRGEALLWSQDEAAADLEWITRDSQITARAGVEPMSWLSPTADAQTRHLVPLLDGSLVLVEDGAYTLRLAYRSFERSDAPPWLVSRSSWRFRFTRGNRGYAVFEPAGRSSTECTQRIDLISATGRLCGRITLREEGTSCVTGSLDQGWDGTVVQQSGHDACSFRWWPRLLAGP